MAKGLYGGTSGSTPTPSGASLSGSFGHAGNIANNLGSTGYNTKGGPASLTNLVPQYKGIVQGIENNPYASAAITGSGAAAGMGEGTANQAFGSVGGLNNLSTMFGGLSQGLNQQGQGVLDNSLSQIPGLEGYANQMLTSGFDPQNALYNRMQQQLTDQLRATNAASGLSSSPYGAGLEGQGLENFNIDWQNNLLNRMNTAASGAGGIYNTIAGLPSAASSIFNIGNQAGAMSGDLATSALGLGQGATQLESAASQLPYQMQQTEQTNKLGGLDALASAKSNLFNQRSTGLQDILQYLGMGDEYLRTAISQQGQNLASGQAGLSGLANIGSSILNLIPALSSFGG